LIDNPRAREVFVVDAFLEQLSLLLPGVVASWYGRELMDLRAMSERRFALQKHLPYGKMPLEVIIC